MNRALLQAGSLLLVGLLASEFANAHLKDPNVPPCFTMVNERVVPMPDTSSSNVIVFSAPEITPINQSRFTTDEWLNVTVRITGQVCSPFNVFLYTKQPPNQPVTLIQQSSPSLLYAPGKVDHRVAHYVTFAIDPQNVKVGATMALSGLRLVVAQYGSGKQLASLDVPLEAVWHASAQLSVSGIPEYECVDDMRLPPVVTSTAPRCANSATPPKGGTPLDVNQDGVCEWSVRDARCDKTHGNLCYRVMAERNGSYQPIAQFYNELKLHNSTSAYRGLSSLERGPLSDTTRYSEWRDGRYESHMYLHNCSRLPSADLETRGR